MKLAWIMLSVLLLGPGWQAAAQTTTVFETLTITPSTVSTDSETEMDYNTSLWYCAIADGYLWENGSIKTSGEAAASTQGACGTHSSSYGSTADLTMSVGTDTNASYELQTNHWLVAAWVCCSVNGVPVFEYYFDEYGYSEVTPQNFTGEGTVSAPGSSVEAGSDSYYIASTYLTESTDLPEISGVDPAWPARGVLNSSGYTVLYGSHFTPGTQVNIDGTGVSMSFTYISDGQVNLYYTIAQSAGTGVHNLSISNTFGASTPTGFTVGDPTPNITSVSPSVWDAGTTTSFSVYGTGFGTSPSLSISGTGIVSYAETSGSDTQVNGTVTVDASAPAQNVTITITSTGYGSGFQSNGGNSSNGAITAQIYPLTVSQSLPSEVQQLNSTTVALSTGDTISTTPPAPSITVSVTPSAMSFTPVFSWGMQSNPNSNCSSGLAFSSNSGTGSVNESITAGSAGCSGIFNAEAFVGTKGSGVFTQVIVPPQIMIATAVGEAGAQTGSGDNTIPSLLLVAKNRFGDSNFPGGSTATWQAVLVPGQFYGASNTTANGVEPELNYAATVFAGTTSVSIPAGCEGYWSPTNGQYTTLQGYTSSTASAVTDAMWSGIGAPGLWSGQPKQAVIKSSIANNVRSGYTSAPAIVLFRVAPSGSDPAIVTVP